MVEAIDIFKLVKADLDKREGLGYKVYGGPMLALDGKRDALKEAYEEALDLAMYLKQVLVERDASREKEIIAIRDNERLRKENMELEKQVHAARNPTWYGPPDMCAPATCNMADVDNTAKVEQLKQTIREREEEIRFLRRRIAFLRIDLSKAQIKTYFDDPWNLHNGDPVA